MSPALGALLMIGGALLFFGWVALLAWMEQQSKQRLRAIEQEERLKALELRVPLPDAAVAQVQVEATRARAAGAIGVLVPLGTGAVLLATTLGLLGLTHRDGTPALAWALLFVIWPVGGAVSIAAVLLSLRALQRRPELKAAPDPAAGGANGPPAGPVNVFEKTQPS
jgi:hypothetical protein